MFRHRPGPPPLSSTLSLPRAVVRSLRLLTLVLARPVRNENSCRDTRRENQSGCRSISFELLMLETREVVESPSK